MFITGDTVNYVRKHEDFEKSFPLSWSKQCYKTARNIVSC